MQRSATTLLVAIAPLMAFAFAVLSGCSNIYPSRVTVEYTPAPVYLPTAGASAVAVRVVVRDARSDKIDVGETLDTIYKKGAPITARNDPVYVLGKSMAAALTAHGFTVKPDAPVIVVIELTQLYTYFRPNLRAGIAQATMVMNVQVIARDGAGTFYQTVAGEGGRNAKDPTGDNRAAGLDQALSRGVDRLADRKDFQRALFAANQLAPVPVPAASADTVHHPSSIAPAN